jgi:hypothetical protein
MAAVSYRAMETWGGFQNSAPELAGDGRRLLYQFGVGLGFLSTIRPDGGPRLHPICPFIVGDSLLAFVVDSPRLRDLIRDGRYARHAFPPERTDDESCVTGVAVPVDEPGRRATAVAAYHVPVADDHRLFELLVDHRAPRGLPAPWRLATGIQPSAVEGPE